MVRFAALFLALAAVSTISVFSDAASAAPTSAPTTQAVAALRAMNVDADESFSAIGDATTVSSRNGAKPVTWETTFKVLGPLGCSEFADDPARSKTESRDKMRVIQSPDETIVYDPKSRTVKLLDPRASVYTHELGGDFRMQSLLAFQGIGFGELRDEIVADLTNGQSTGSVERTSTGRLLIKTWCKPFVDNPGTFAFQIELDPAAEMRLVRISNDVRDMDGAGSVQKTDYQLSWKCFAKRWYPCAAHLVFHVTPKGPSCDYDWVVTVDKLTSPADVGKRDFTVDALRVAPGTRTIDERLQFISGGS